MTRHLANVHDIGVTWKYCSVTGCEYKSKNASDLTEHVAHVHNIGVIWKYCSVTGCEYKFIAKGSKYMRGALGASQQRVA